MSIKTAREIVGNAYRNGRIDMTHCVMLRDALLRYVSTGQHQIGNQDIIWGGTRRRLRDVLASL